MNQVGLTHLSFLVDDLDGLLAKLRGLGATVLDATRLDGQGKGPNAVFVTDPDGTRIELVEGDFDPASYGSRR
jgi:lactoylglutathione lyase